MNFNTDEMYDHYQTPQWLFGALNNMFKFTHDLACDSTNKLIEGSPCYDQGFDAFEGNWDDFKMSYIYPPFSKPHFGKFLQKAFREYERGNSSVIVVPIKTLAVDYFSKIRPPLIMTVYPRINFLFNGQENFRNETIALLCYVHAKDIRYEGPNRPTMKFLDLGRVIPMRKSNEQRDTYHA